MADVNIRAAKAFKNVDVDENGYIDFGEWCTATIDQEELIKNEANLLAAFKLFDRDHSNTIDASEIAAILGNNVTEQENIWSEVIKEVDDADDGQITFDKFKLMFKRSFAVRQQTLSMFADDQNDVSAQASQQITARKR